MALTWVLLSVSLMVQRMEKKTALQSVTMLGPHWARKWVMTWAPLTVQRTETTSVMQLATQTAQHLVTMSVLL